LILLTDSKGFAGAYFISEEPEMTTLLTRPRMNDTGEPIQTVRAGERSQHSFNHINS
jgi:hypothetical protein